MDTNRSGEELDLSNALRIADQLRGCLRFDYPSEVESRLETAARDAANELERLVAFCKRLNEAE